MSTQGLDEFRARYGQLTVTACEWRAMQADPHAVAADVFVRLARHRDAPTLSLLYTAIQAAVQQAYAASNTSSFLDKMRGQHQTLDNVPRDSKREADLRVALSNLRTRDRELLQLALWDELTPSELAEVLRIEAAAVPTRIAEAIGRFATLAAKRGIQLDSLELPGVLRALKPGTQTRGG